MLRKQSGLVKKRSGVLIPAKLTYLDLSSKLVSLFSGYADEDDPTVRIVTLFDFTVTPQPNSESAPSGEAVIGAH